MTHTAEYTVQVLVETEDGTDLPRRTKEYIEGAIPKMFGTGRDIRTVITVADGDENVIVTKFDNNPTEALRERAWK